MKALRRVATPQTEFHTLVDDFMKKYLDGGWSDYDVSDDEDDAAANEHKTDSESEAKVRALKSDSETASEEGEKKIEHDAQPLILWSEDDSTPLDSSCEEIGFVAASQSQSITTTEAGTGATEAAAKRPSEDDDELKLALEKENLKRQKGEDTESAEAISSSTRA